MAVAAALTLCASSAQAADETLGGTHERTRFIIGLEKAVPFQVFSLSNPNRLVVELAETKVALPTLEGDKPVGLIKSFRGGIASANKMRIVIDVTEPVVIAKSGIEKTADGKGQVLALEIVPVSGFQPQKTGKKLTPPYALGAGAVQPPAPVPAVSPKLKAERTYKPTIVIDPGHGGMDSGATKNGAVEKDVMPSRARVQSLTKPQELVPAARSGRA